MIGELIGALGITEPGAGSDVGSMRTSAVKDGDDYIINGSKIFITNGGIADFVILAAKTDKEAGHSGITLFLVDTDTPGFETENKTTPRETHALSAGAKLMSAEAVAKGLLTDIGTKRFIILANRPSKFFYALRRLSSRLTFAEIDRIIAKAQKHSK